jgi:subtilisin family serine protease
VSSRRFSVNTRSVLASDEHARPSFAHYGFERTALPSFARFEACISLFGRHTDRELAPQISSRSFSNRSRFRFTQHSIAELFGLILPSGNLIAAAHMATTDLAWFLEQIGIHAAWDRANASTPVRIAIHDAGFAVGHPNIARRIVPGWNFDHDSNDVRPSPVAGGGWTRDAGHGTACASVVCDVLGPEGVADQCKIVPFRRLFRASLASEPVTRPIA